MERNRTFHNIVMIIDENYITTFRGLVSYLALYDQHFYICQLRDNIKYRKAVLIYLDMKKAHAQGNRYN